MRVVTGGRRLMTLCFTAGYEHIWRYWKSNEKAGAEVCVGDGVGEVLCRPVH
jgi:hypothetical protein